MSDEVHRREFLRAGEELRLAYLVYVHLGTAADAPIEKWWKAFGQQSHEGTYYENDLPT